VRLSIYLESSEPSGMSGGMVERNIWAVRDKINIHKMEHDFVLMKGGSCYNGVPNISQRCII